MHRCAARSRGETVEIDIQPPTDVYDTFGRLNYKPWFAIAEFVDNATQNFFDHEAELRSAAGHQPVLSISIDYDSAGGGALTITDNAHGMGADELSRALRLGAKPPNTSGRSEFGMGLKTAACWFGTVWEVRTTRLGEDVEYHAVVDLPRLAETGGHVVEVTEARAHPLAHGTTISIQPLRKKLFGRQIERIKDTLTSMYRSDLRSGRIEIRWKDCNLSYEEPALFQEELEPERWRTYRQEVSVTVEDPSTGREHVATGWVGILKTMSSRDNGLALLRRGRVIIGGPDDGWRPHELVGQLGSPAWKRMVGELNLDSFPVNFSKDGFAWDGGLEERLIAALQSPLKDYRIKAANLRVKEIKLRPTDLNRSVDGITTGMNHEALRRDLALNETPARPLEDPVKDPVERQRLLRDSTGPTRLKVPTPQGEIVAQLYLRDIDPKMEWISISFAQPDEIDVFLNTNHPFVAEYSDDDAGIAMIARFALALALSEKRARMLEGDRIFPDDLRTHLDVFLRHFTAV
jgi:hypothetical protein